MKKRLSRLSERITIVLTALLLLAVILTWIYGNPTLYFLLITLTLVWGFRIIAGESCPHCGKVTRRSLRWSKPDAGYCSHCGKLMKFDDAD